jgi:RNA polymerase sigma-70 factor (ECF subfamily)
VAAPDFAQLALPFMGALYRTACRLTSRAAEAEDLVQETYLEGFRCFATLKDPDRCRPWLFRILHNLWCERRARERTRSLVRALATRVDGNLEREITETGYSDEVERALAALPEEFRTAVLLVTVEEMSYDEVAEVMGCPIGTVRSRVARGRALLAANLAKGNVIRLSGKPGQAIEMNTPPAGLLAEPAEADEAARRTKQPKQHGKESS